MNRFPSPARERTPIPDQIAHVLRNGPLDAKQIAQRLGLSMGQVNHNLASERFEKLKESKGHQAAVWGLKTE